MPSPFPPISSRGAKAALLDSTRTVTRRFQGPQGGNAPEIEEVVHAHPGEHFGLVKGVKMLQYPKGVGTNPEYPHWLKIETHVRATNTALMSSYRASKMFVPPEAKKQALDTSDDNARIGAIAGATAAFNVVQQGLSAVTSGLSPVGKLVGNVLVPAAAGAVGGVAGDLLTRMSGYSGYLTLNSVMALGLQEAPSAQYDARWESQDLGEILATGGFSPISIARETIRNKVGFKGAAAEAAGLTKEAIGGAMELNAGKVKNPYKEQLFKGSDFRNFTFRFNFLPDSIDEAKTILEMIKLLRATMLPALDPSGYYLIYPAEYTLTYMYRGDVNAHVNGIGTCVLTSLTTKYGGQDFVTFRGAESLGTPAEFSISMSFREIVPITANQVMEANL